MNKNFTAWELISRNSLEENGEQGIYCYEILVNLLSPILTIFSKPSDGLAASSMDEEVAGLKAVGSYNSYRGTTGECGF